MNITKTEFTKKMRDWFEKYLEDSYSPEYDIDVILPKSSLSMINRGDLKSISDISSYEFRPDILGILTGADGSKLAFLNRNMHAIGIKDIGELLCYCRLAKPIEAFISSLKGVATEVTLLLMRLDVQERLLKYDNKYITLFGWNSQLDEPEIRSMIPSSKREKF